MSSSSIEKGISYGFSVRSESGEIFASYLDEFQTEVMMFEGFMDSTSQLAQQMDDKGFKFLDFGLIRFCVGRTMSKNDVIFVVNSSTSKREGFKGLEEVISYVNNNITTLDQFSNHKDKLKEILINFNHTMGEVHQLRTQLLEILEKRKIKSEHVDLDNLDLGIYLKTQDILHLNEKERRKSLEKFVDSFTSNN